VDAALGTVRPGDIVLMHDIHPTTVDAVPQILRRLRARGYHSSPSASC
jgi:peptidoglycan/xylan/chitin deacetylase (PgdA/CDA1 family)